LEVRQTYIGGNLHWRDFGGKRHVTLEVRETLKVRETCYIGGNLHWRDFGGKRDMLHWR